MCDLCSNEDFRFTTRVVIDDRVIEQNICEACAVHLYQCNECGAWSSSISEEGGMRLCSICRESYVRCSACGETVHNSCTVTRGDDVLCESCESRRRRENDPIKRWDWRPSEFKLIGDDDIHFGVEIEVELDDEAYASEFAEEAHAVMRSAFKDNVIYFKSDGSLENGFEVVTMPHTIEAYKASKLKAVVDYLRKNGARSHNTNTCGLHVHIERAGIGGEHASRINYLVHGLRSFMEVVARRTRSSYAKYKTPEMTTYNDDRYEAVNFFNRNSIELRFFKGTLAWNTIIATIQFSKCIVEFTRHMDSEWMEAQPMTTLREELTQFCIENGGDELNRYFSERNITNE